MFFSVSILFIVFASEYCVCGFVFVDTTSLPNTNDVQYLHLLLADEKSERMRLQNEVTQLQATVQRMAEQVDSLDQTGSVTKQPNVAFRAQLTHDIGTVHKGQVIIFDNVELNLGNGYDVRHGKFTAAYNGTYQFSMSLGNPGNNPGHLFLMHNSKAIEFVFTGYDPSWEMAAISTVAELHTGDDVWVEGERFIGGQVYTDHLHTGFSGYLIRNL